MLGFSIVNTEVNVLHYVMASFFLSSPHITILKKLVTSSLNCGFGDGCETLESQEQ